jgi:hypothetical protein
MVTWTVNYYFGQEQSDGGEPGGPDGFFRVFDTYVTVTPTAALSLGVDANYVTNEVNRQDASLSLKGLGAYARYQLTTASALGVRYERLDDEGLFGGIDQVLHETTVTGEYKLRTDSSCAESIGVTGRTSASSPVALVRRICEDTRTPC